MFLKPINNLTQTLAFRLAVWYALIFTLCSIFALSFFYYKVSAMTLQFSDRELEEEISEFTAIMAEGGMDQVKKYMKAEVDSDETDVFFRLFSADGQVLHIEGTPLGNLIPSPDHIFEKLKTTGNPIFATLKPPEYPYPVRTLCGVISPEAILQVGKSLEEKEKYIDIFRRLLLNLIVPLFFVSTVIGWLMARQALKGVEEVTHTAMDISKGAYDKRVQVKKRLLEISRLANTFNSMLDRIQSLLQGMAEVTDNVAHDLRSPLARIRGIAEMTLFRKSSLADYEKMAASTIEECDNLIHLINTMLDITETEAGLNVFQRKPVAMKKLFSDACDLFYPLADEKGVRLVTRLPLDEMVIQGDKGGLQRIVTNLLDNAIKYTPPGGEVTISVCQENGRLHMEFKDTGVGVSEKDLPMIFNRFFRCDNSRTQPGTGLGLCLVKAIINALGGDVMVTSKINEGSTFAVTIPL